MKKKAAPKEIQESLESPTNGAQGITCTADASRDNAPHSVLSPSIRQAIVDAQQGEREAWALLYAAAAAYVAGGATVPVDMRDLIAGRLQALSNALKGTADARALLLDAAAPMPAGKARLVGAKRKTLTIDDAARDVLWYQAYMGGSLKAAARKLESLITKPDNKAPLYLATSLEARAKKIRKQQRDAEKQHIS